MKKARGSGAPTIAVRKVRVETCPHDVAMLERNVEAQRFTCRGCGFTMTFEQAAEMIAKLRVDGKL